MREEQTAILKIAELQSSTESKSRKSFQSHKKETSRLSETIDILKKKVADKDQLQGELSKMRRQLKEEKLITVKIKVLQERLDETERHVSAMANRNEDLSEKLSDTQSSKIALESEIREAKSSQAELLGRVNNLLERLDTKDDALTNMSNDKSTLVEKVSKIERANVRLMNEISVANTENDTLKSMCDNTEMISNELSSKLEESKNGASETITELHKRISHTEEKLSSVKSANGATSKMLEQVTRNNTALSDELSLVKATQLNEATTWREERNRFKKRVRESERALVMVAEEKDRQVKLKAEDLSSVKAAKEALEKKLVDLHSENESLCDEVRETNMKMNESQIKNESSATRLEETETRLSSIEKAKGVMGQKLVELQCKNELLSNEVRESNKNLVEMQSNNRSLAVELSETDKKLSKSQIEEQALRKHRDQMQNKKESVVVANLINSSKEQSGAFQNKIINLQNKIETVESNLTDENKKLQQSLCETKKSLEIASNQTAILEMQKAELEKKLTQELFETKGAYSATVSRLRGHIDDTEMALGNVKNDKATLQRTVDDLAQMNEDLSLELDETSTLMSRESQTWKEEKHKLLEEKSKLKKRLHESEKTLVMVANQKTALDSEKTDLERKLSTELIASKGKHSRTIAELQVRIEDTELRLACVQTEKHNLQQSVDELHQINHDLSTEINESQSMLSSETVQWSEEKQDLQKCLEESELVLTRVDGEKQTLVDRLDMVAGENQKLSNRLRDSEKTLVMVADQKAKLEKMMTEEKEEMMDCSRGLADQKQKLLDQKVKMAKQKAELEETMIAEKKEMMDRQRGLETMLKDALKGEVEVEEDKENSKKTSPKKRSISGLAPEDMKSIRSQQEPTTPPKSRAIPSRPRQPLSPTGSVVRPPRDSSVLRRRTAAAPRDSSAMRRRLAIDP